MPENEFTSMCAECPKFEECSALPAQGLSGCPLFARTATLSPKTLSKDELAKLPKHLRRAYHVSKVAKNIFEDPLDEAAQLRHWMTIACTARLAITALGSDTLEMQGMKGINEVLANQRDELKAIIEEQASESHKLRAAMRLIEAVASES